jgi:ABC-type transport system involved in multi-copper enzyme maturation permease subunit
MQLGYLRLDWQSLGIAIGACVAAVIALALLRRVMGWLLGPIFVYETTRLARKGHTFWLRVAFAVGTLGLLLVVAPKERDINYDPRVHALPSYTLVPQLEGAVGPPSYYSADYHDFAKVAAAHRATVMARFAAEFSNAFLLILAIVVMLITPIYLATAVSEEKERRSIEFLLATNLTNYEIVIGKLAARLLNISGLLLAPLPILAITQVWGGVDLGQLAHGLLVILVAMISYASVSMFCSVAFSRTRSAVIAAYVILLLINLLSAAAGFFDFQSPIGYILRLRDIDPAGMGAVVQLARIAGYCASQALLTVCFLVVSVLAVRRIALRSSARIRRVLPSKEAPDYKPVNSPVHPLTVKDNPPIGDDPLVWKERYLGRTFGGWALSNTFWLYLYLILGVITVLAVAIAINGWQSYFKTSLGLPMRVGFVALTGSVVIGIGMRMASSVSREREQQTLVSLLSMPIHSSAIIRAKWNGTIARSRQAFLGLAVLAIVTSLVVGNSCVDWLLIPLAVATHIWLVGNLGLFLSVVCRSTNRAISFLLVVLLTISVGSWAVSYFSESETNQPRKASPLGPTRKDAPLALKWYEDPFFGALEQPIFKEEVIAESLSPVQVWWRLTAIAADPDDPDWKSGRRIPAATIFTSLLAYYWVGTGLYILAWLRFRREGNRA